MALILGAVVISVRADGTVIDFATQDPDLLIAGDVANEHLGTDLVIGDLDGDSIDDLVVGAPWATGPNNRGFAGHAYIFFGGRERPTLLHGDNADVTILGAMANDAIGGSFDRLSGTMAIGDVNNDPFNDLILGAPGVGSAGRVYIIFGRERGVWETTPIIDLAGMPGDVVIAGASDANDALGSAVAVGDVNGDGIGDLIAGAPRADESADGRTNAGKVYIFFGRETWQQNPYSAEEDADVRVIGVQDFHFLGSGLAVGQLGGTDVADIAIGALSNLGGEVHVLFGRERSAWEATPIIDLATTPADWVVFAVDRADDVGRHLAVGDVSGDRQPDLIIGAPGGDGPANGRMEAGEVAVIFGPRASGTTIRLADDASFTLFGPQGGTSRRPGGRLGDNLVLGDFNDDGIMDIAAGALQGDGATDALDKAGEAYVIFGGGDLPAVWDLGTTDADIAIHGREHGDQLGRVAAGDLDTVAPDDLALGAYQADIRNGDVLNNAGQAFITYRQFTAPTPTLTSTPSTSPTAMVTPPAGTAATTPTVTATVVPGTVTPSATPAPTSARVNLPLIMKDHSGHGQTKP